MKNIIRITAFLLVVLTISGCALNKSGVAGKETDPYSPELGTAWKIETTPTETESTNPTEQQEQKDSTIPIEIATAPQEIEPEIPPETEPIEDDVYSIDIDFFDKTEFCYTLLKDNEKRCYKAMLDCINEMEPKISISKLRINVDDFKLIYRYMMYDHPEIFWLNEPEVYFSKSGGNVTNVIFKYNDLASNKNEILSQIEIFVAAYVNSLKDLTDIEKEMKIHDYLIKEVEYQEGKYDQTIYSTFIEKKTVCAGFAKGFQYMMNKCGLMTYYVTGDIVEDSKTTKHAWNIVKLGDSYYAVDVTGDNTDKEDVKKLYSMFNFHESDFLGTYVRNTDSEIFPKSEGTEYTIRNIYGVSNNIYTVQQNFGNYKIIYSLDSYKNYFADQITKYGMGEYEIKYIVEGQTLYDTIKDYLHEADFAETLLTNIAIEEQCGGFYYDFGLNTTIFNDVYIVTQNIIFTES